MSPQHFRRIAGVAAGAAAAVAIAGAPALASEDAPAPAAPLPSPLAPVTIAPPAPPAPPAPQARLRLAVRSARLAPRRLRHGRSGRLRLTMSVPARVQVVLQRRSHGRLVRVAVLRAPARGTTVLLRLSKHLRRGRYRVTIVASADGAVSSRAVHRSLTVV
jgi:hypothetical protein